MIGENQPILATRPAEEARRWHKQQPMQAHYFRFGLDTDRDGDGRYKCLCHTTAKNLYESGVARGEEWYEWTGHTDRHGSPIEPTGALREAWLRAGHELADWTNAAM